MGKYGYLWSEIKTENRIQQVRQGEERQKNPGHERGREPRC